MPKTAGRRRKAAASAASPAGAEQNEAVQDEAARDGTAWDGTAWDGTARDGTAQGDEAAQCGATPCDAVQYTVRAASLAEHRWAVEMRIDRPAARQGVSLPAWIPGSYLIREFARHLNHLRAEQGARACAVQQTGKADWVVDCRPGQPLLLRYEVYAFDNSVRAAWLDAQRGFFNATALLLRAHGHEGQPHALHVPVPDAVPAHAPAWRLATAMQPVAVDARGFGAYRAADYDELADHPVEMGAFWQGEFIACGVPHRFVVAGAPPTFDGRRLLRDAQKICEAAIRFWHPRGKPPFAQYLFMLNAVHDGYGGLEHRASTALICARRDLPRRAAATQAAPAAQAATAKTAAAAKAAKAAKTSQTAQTAQASASAASVPLGDAASLGDGYLTLLGLISHEYFHAWNVKRLRPAEFTRFDYQRENHTRLLWFFEGFTSYYDDLLLRRAGLIDDAQYLGLLGKTIAQVRQTPGRAVQSVAQASHDAWLRYYRPDENTPNSTVSYYTKGALVALCLDLTLRREGRATLDDVMRALWLRCHGGPMRESDVADTLAALGGRSFGRELAEWVHGTDDLPLQPLLEAQGVRIAADQPTPAQALGLRVAQERAAIVVKAVLAGSAASAAGFCAGDEWLGLDVPDEAPDAADAADAADAWGAARPAGWRLDSLDDLPLYAAPGQRVFALVSRDKRLLRLPLVLPKAGGYVPWRLQPAVSSRAQAWPAC